MIFKRYRAVWYAKKFIGTEYRYGDDEYGGDDPIMGMDCSGYFSEVLRGVGLLDDDERLSSMQLYERFKHATPINKRRKGLLYLYGNSAGRIYHVAMVIDRNTIVEAGGGSRSTKDSKTAAIRNAFVRIRPITHREAEMRFIVDPFKRG